MENMEFTTHARDTLEERNIPEDWVWRAIESPRRSRMGRDGNKHYFKPIPEFGGQILHVVVNPHTIPKRVVTASFDHRERK